MSEEDPPLVDISATLAKRLSRGFGAADESRTALAESDRSSFEAKSLTSLVKDLDEEQANERTPLTLNPNFHSLFDRNPHLVRALIHRPHEFLRGLDSTMNTENENFGSLRKWAIFAFIAQALWDYVDSGPSASRAHRRLLPQVSRIRFLALSEPFRHRPEEIRDGGSLYQEMTQVFGPISSHLLLRNAWEARDVWRSHVDLYQTVPAFHHAPPEALETEVRDLAFTSSDSRSPLILAAPIRLEKSDASPRKGEGLQTPPADQAVVEWAVEHHLLPRFALREARVATIGKSDPLLWATLVLTAVTFVAAIISLSPPFPPSNWISSVPSLYLSLITGALVYAMIAWGTLSRGRTWAMPMMLRLPAAATLGMIVLIALPPHWWMRMTSILEIVPLVFLTLGVCFGYLLLEARNHNTGPAKERKTGDHTRSRPEVEREGRSTSRTMAARAALVLAIGLVHSFLVALLGLGVVAPVFSQEGEQLAMILQNPGTSVVLDPPATGSEDSVPCPLAILLAATVWCLAAGVFSQILWDDQPVTAPLGHRRWRSEK
ncbi:hypothetical protein [Nocardiopsis sp. NPDC006938]|uniref:hypothetical protein n=1 Tax=Nocardiopsis sp. NPDC006938 TaxID=3364337 RepID=UPI0036BE7176